MVNAKDYKMIHPQGGFQKYVRVGKYVKGLGKGWEKIGDELKANDKLVTFIKCWGDNLGNVAGSSELGTVRVNYYIAFKTRRYT